MDSRLGNWLQVGANLGILVGLILVGFQMRQASELLELQLRKSEAENYIASEVSLVGEEWPRVWQKQFDDPAGLTLAEQRILETTLWADNVFRWVVNYRLYEDGLTDAKDWQTLIDQDAPWVFGNPYGRAWWDETKGAIGPTLPGELVAYIEALLEDLRLSETEDFYERVRDRADGYVNGSRER